MEMLPDIYADIRAALGAQRKRQKELANIAGVSTAYVSDMLAGNRPINPKMAVACETLLGISADWLLREQEQRRMDRLLAEAAQLRADWRASR